MVLPFSSEKEVIITFSSNCINFIGTSWPCKRLAIGNLVDDIVLFFIAPFIILSDVTTSP